jgi:uncharacterized protein (TIGR03067 family)
MTYRAAAVFLMCIAPTSFALGDEVSSKQVKELEGEWRWVEVERDGEKATADDVTSLRLVFNGDEITIKKSDGTGRERKKTFKLDSGKSPKAIDITSLDGQEQGKTQACIYSLDKVRLKICMPYAPAKDPSERPAEFKTQAGDGLLLLVLERVKPE